MMDNYFKSTDARISDAEHQRLVATKAALEIIKAAISTPVGAKDTDYDLQLAAKHIEPLADAIQAAIEKR